MSTFRKIKEAEDHHAEDEELWMLPYSTLMLTLVILFIVFYAMSALNSVGFETMLTELASTKPDNKNAERSRKEIGLAKEMNEYVKKEGLSDKAQVVLSAQYIKLKLESPALFDSGSADIKQGSLPLLQQMVKKLKSMDNVIIVEGHTDNIPIHGGRFRSNWELSTARAFSVIRHFISEGISPKYLVAHGFGEFRPLFSNDTEEGRARNRRIEITIVRGGRSS